MELLTKFQDGVFRPLEPVMGIEEGEEVEIHFEREEWNKLAEHNPSLKFLEKEPDIYTEQDIKERP